MTFICDPKGPLMVKMGTHAQSFFACCLTQPQHFALSCDLGAMTLFLPLCGEEAFGSTGTQGSASRVFVCSSNAQFAVCSNLVSMSLPGVGTVRQNHSEPLPSGVSSV